MDGALSGVLDERGAALVTAIFTVSIALLCLVVVFWIYKMRRPNGALLSGGSRRGRNRLAVVETLAIDPRRRLVLVRCNEEEHLILIGGPSDVVVETGIKAVDVPDVEPAAAPETASRSRTADADEPPSRLATASASLGALVVQARRRAQRDRPPAPKASASVQPPAEESAAHAPAAHAVQNPQQVAPQPMPAAAIAPAPPPAAQFPAERFGAPAASPHPERDETHAPSQSGGVAAGNPFDAADFGAVLDEEMARTRQSEAQHQRITQATRQADRQKATASPPSKTAQASSPEAERTLEEEMARLLGDLSGERK